MATPGYPGSSLTCGSASQPTPRLASKPLTCFRRKSERTAHSVKNPATTIMITATARFPCSSDSAAIHPLRERGEQGEHGEHSIHRMRWSRGRRGTDRCTKAFGGRLQGSAKRSTRAVETRSRSSSRHLFRGQSFHCHF